MKEILKISFLFLLVVLVAVGCEDDDENTCCDPTNPECPNYDPCLDIEEPTAKIQMRESYLRPGHGWLWTPFDSVFYNEVEYSSPFVGPQFTHTWYLGAEVIEEPVFTRTHSVERPQFITVSHVLTYPVDSTCYPNSIGRDSTSATYYIIESFNEYLTYSRFRGVFENETDSFDFEFKYVYADDTPVILPPQSNNTPFIVGLNFHNEQDSTSFIGLNGRNLAGVFAGNGNWSPRGIIEIDSVDRTTARLEYRYHSQDHVVNARILE